MVRRSAPHLAVAYLLMLVLLCQRPEPAGAQSTVVVRFAPAAGEVGEGEALDVAVEVVAVTDLYGADIRLTFDPSVIEVVDADPYLAGIQVALGLFLDPGFVLRNAADNSAGTVHFAMTQLAPSAPKSGSGNLIVVRFAGRRAGGSSPLTLTNAQLAGPGGITIPSSPVPGSLTVAASGTGPTATPIPTQGAGTPMPTGTQPVPVTPTTALPSTAVPSTPVPTDTPPPSPTSPPAVTPVPPTQTAPPPSGTASPVPARPTTAGPAAPRVTSSPTEAVAATAVSVTPQASDGATAVAAAAASPTTLPVLAREGPVGQDSSGPGAGTGATGRSGLTSTLLWVAAAALGLAVALGGLAAALLWVRKRRAAGPEGEER